VLRLKDHIVFFRALYRQHGWRALVKQFRFHYWRPWSRELIERYAPAGRGLELGVGAFTIAPISRTLLSDAFVEHAGNASLAQEFFSADNIPYPDNSFSFLVSEHVLEHLPNPLKTLREWMRVLNPGGALFLFLPHRDRTFDARRARTSLSLLQAVDRDGVEPYEIEQWEEWKNLALTHPSAQHYVGQSREEALRTNSLHRYVWVAEDIVDLLKFQGWDVLEFAEQVPDRLDSFVVVAVKR